MTPFPDTSGNRNTGAYSSKLKYAEVRGLVSSHFWAFHKQKRFNYFIFLFWPGVFGLTQHFFGDVDGGYWWPHNLEHRPGDAPGTPEPAPPDSSAGGRPEILRRREKDRRGVGEEGRKRECWRQLLRLHGAPARWTKTSFHLKHCGASVRLHPHCTIYIARYDTAKNIRLLGDKSVTMIAVL